jgi:hypothetical protein
MSDVTPSSKESDIDEYTIMNLSMFVRRLARLLRQHDPDSKAATQALDFIERKNLQGSPLRTADEPSARLCGYTWNDSSPPCGLQAGHEGFHDCRPSQPPGADLVACARVFHEAYCPSCPDHPCGLGDALAEHARSALTKISEQP